ncbi:MAG: hypothetical protein QM758_22315 [Armatimonas sp.]
MNNTEIIKELERALSHETLVSVTREFDGRSWRGFIVGLEEEWVLMHMLSGATMKLNGYTALRVSDISKIVEDQSFATTALRMMGERPRPQHDLLLLDLPGLLSSASPVFPLMAIFREKLPNGGCYIGKVREMKPKKVEITAVNRGGEWMEAPYKFRYKDITRLDLGDGYLDALWLVARHTRREAK